MLTAATLLTALASVASAASKIQLTPVMGWSGYNSLMQNSGICDRAGANGYNEATVLETASILRTSGLAQLGYAFLNLDDCWIAQNRSAEGKLVADPTRFPHGMPFLASQLHAQGLKLGLYASASLLTCRNFPGSQGFEEVDAATFAEYGADFVKLDSCGGVLATGAEAWVNQYTRWSNALAASGRDIVFSCSWAFYYSNCVEKNGAAACGASPIIGGYIAKICNMWRYDFDLEPTWTNARAAEGFTGGGIYDLLVKAAISPVVRSYRAITGAGAFSDPDFLIVGCATDGPCEPGTPHPLPPMTQVQQRTQFSMWCLLAAPLIIGSDIRAMDSYTLATLGNADAIAINQDEKFAPPRLLNGTSTQGNPLGAVWARDMKNGDTAVALLNLGPTALVLGLDVAQIGWPAGATGGKAMDVWSKAVKNVEGPSYNSTVPPFSTTLLRFLPPTVQGHVGGH